MIANVPDVPTGTAPAISKWLLHTPLPFSFAAFGVSQFFLISGFVIPLSLNQATTPSFLRARAWRIIPTYVAGFSFTLLALAAASHVYGKPFPYAIDDVAAHLIPGVRAVLRTLYAAVTKSSTGAAAICGRGGVKSGQW
jgi:peptidoglycan/LPS O-acetylase OafA/YrhL